MVRRNEGGGLVPRPGTGFVHARDEAEKRVATRPSWKNSLEVSPGIVTTTCGFILHERREELMPVYMREHAAGQTTRSTISH